MTKDLDIAIVGAGAAGLACARALSEAGHDVAIFEARDRIGGRILTVRDARVPLPIELGAEFIHGDAPETEQICREAGLHAYEVCGDHEELRRGRARGHDFQGGIDRVFRRIDPNRPDESFAAFLKRRPGGTALAADRRTAAAYVQGYHAADLTQISVRSIAPDPGEPASASVSKMARILEGQDRLAVWLAGQNDLNPSMQRSMRRAAARRGVRERSTRVGQTDGRGAGPGPGPQPSGGAAVEVRLGTAVTGVTWKRGEAVLDVRPPRGAPSAIAARAVVFTVPVGVLKAEPGDAGAIAFRPEPPRLREALDGLLMGTVTRLVVLFRELPWTRLERGRAGPGGGKGGGRKGARGASAPDRFEALERAAFLHTPGSPFPIWWTARPMRWPLLVAWSGGPPAARLSRMDAGAIQAEALASLARHLGTSRRRLASRVEGTWLNNWDTDPYARGAYSYVRVGGDDPGRVLARPVAGTLFFAGEATEPLQSGTVEGAIASGLRAARQVERALK